MSMDPRQFGAHADKIIGVVQGENNTTNIDNRTVVLIQNDPEQRLVARRSSARRGKPLSRHDGCWRLLITIQKDKQVEGGNIKGDEAFFVDSEIVEPDASNGHPLQELCKAYKSLPSNEPRGYEAIFDENVIERLITTAHNRINQRPVNQSFLEIIVIISLEYELITDIKWIKLLKKVKNFEGDISPVAMACLTRPPGTDDDKWTPISTRSIENSHQVVDRLFGKELLKDLNWLLIEVEPGENADQLATLINPAVSDEVSITSRKTFQQLDKWKPPEPIKKPHGRRRPSTRPENFFENHHALWLRWPVTTSGNFAYFKKRLDKVLRSGIPFFFLESVSAGANSATSACHLLDWCCDEFVQVYCERHRRPESSPANEIERNECLRDACLYWDDHRYKPFQTILPTSADLLVSPLIPNS